MRAVGYCRVSRDDVRSGTTLENHIAMLVTLADQRGFCLDRASIIAEIESGGKDDRAGVLHLLELCTSRQVTHVLTYDVSRMTRGMEDHWAAIKRAFFRGNVTLVTPRSPAGGYRFDNELDTTQLDLEAVLARRERWYYGVKRHDHNVQKARRGKRYCGSPPYGYRKLRPPTDINGAVVPPTAEDADAGLAVRDADGRPHWRSHITHPTEYPVVCEIFRRIRSQGAKSITFDLNNRGVLPPLLSRGYKRATPAVLWTESSLRIIIDNPWYAGYLTHRTYSARECGQTRLPRDKWIYAEEEGDWSHPITLEEHAELREIISTRRVIGGPHETQFGLLAGILRCQRDRPMHRSLDRYACRCQSAGVKHNANTIAAVRIEPYVRAIVEGALASLDLEALPDPRAARQRTQILAEITAAERSLRETTAQLDGLLGQAALAGLPEFGAERYRLAVARLSAEGEELRGRVAALRAELRRPDEVTSWRMLRQALAAPGALWEEREGWSREDMRRLVQLVVDHATVEAIAPGHHYIRHVAVTMQPWFACYKPPRLPRYVPGNASKPGRPGAP